MSCFLVNADLSSIYISGWQCSSTASSTNEPGPDFADYPMDTVPKKCKFLYLCCFGIVSWQYAHVLILYFYHRLVDTPPLLQAINSFGLNYITTVARTKNAPLPSSLARIPAQRSTILPLSLRMVTQATVV